MDDARAQRLRLATCDELHHGAACRLSVDLERWTGAAAEGPGAVELGVPADALEVARGLLPEARATARRLEAAAERAGARVVTLGEPGYPEAFGPLDLPPPAVWIAGELPDAPAVAIVGARRASPYGTEIAAWLATEVARAGATVVSGFAIGVDAAAHRGALEAPAGSTVAVLGCGLGVDYPRGHRPLGERIRTRGALLTEFAPGRAPRPWQFPVRNRLIAALAQAVVVVEGAPRSGSLVTARLAADLGRDLLAVPGRVTDELALGPNALIADGAAPVLTPNDLLDAIGLGELGATSNSRPPSAAPEPPPGLAPAARALWLAAAADPAPAETLAARAGLSIDRALATLLELELAAHLRRSPDGSYGPRLP